MNNPKQTLHSRGSLGYTSGGRVADGRASPDMINDYAKAANEVIHRLGIQSMSNAELIKEAQRKSDRIIRGDTEGPRHHNAIVGTLFEMLREMEDRIGRAPRDKVTLLPKLADVSWNPDDPLAGVVDAVDPFGMSNFWTLRILEAVPVPPQRRNRRRSPTPRKKKQSPKRQKPPIKTVPPTVSEAIGRARDAVGDVPNRPGNFGDDLWYYCILWQMEQQSRDCWYMNANDMVALLSEERSLLSHQTGYPKRIKMDADTAVTGGSNYLLSTSQRATLDRLHPGWPRKVVYGSGTKLDKDLYVLKLAHCVVDPMIKKFFASKSRDARTTLTKLVHDAGKNPKLLLQKLANLRAEINAARIWWARNVGARYGSDPGLGLKLLKARWDKAWISSKSFLGCTRDPTTRSRG